MANKGVQYFSYKGKKWWLEDKCKWSDNNLSQYLKVALSFLRIGKFLHERKRVFIRLFLQMIVPYLRKTRWKYKWQLLQRKNNHNWPQDKCQKIIYASSIAQIWGITLWPQELEEVQRFTYLGSVITWNGDAEMEVKWPIGKATAVFQTMNKIWLDHWNLNSICLPL